MRSIKFFLQNTRENYDSVMFSDGKSNFNNRLECPTLIRRRYGYYVVKLVYAFDLFEKGND